MSGSLYSLVYLSHNEIRGPRRLVVSEIEQILHVARTKNTKSGITGALMFNDRFFAQVLEGPRIVLEQTFEDIQCDPRHSNVVILDFAPTDGRLFGDWSMGYMAGATGASDEFNHITQGSGFDLAKFCGDKIVSLLLRHLTETRVAEALS